ncbi:MAG: hypothetical protein K0S41_3481 [Anaerocolumna sp.]|jgi:hypothetical protein|nr:hypothetical protein [Anaerocolumna sp.]
MPNYYDYLRNNEQMRVRNQQGYNPNLSSTANKNNREKSMDDLIIDDNSVYEIDQECFERVKRSRNNQRQDWNKR